MNPKCTRCRTYFVPELKSSGLPYKSCSKCRVSRRKKHPHCEHGRRPYYCIDCGGAGICKHKKQKHHCRDCGGACVCKHGRPRIRTILRENGIKKSKRTTEYLGCSLSFFKAYIEKQLTSEMCWDNIHIDHIKPVSKFDLSDPEQFAQCCHYSNLQPLLSEDNLSKSNKWSDEDELNWQENICDIWLI